MNLVCCEHPVKIFVIDEVTKKRKVQYVPCGKCNSCRNRHADKLVARLENEAKCWPYVYFFTLTYNDKCVPTLHLDSHNRLLDFRTGDCIDVSEFMDSKSFQYLRRRGYKVYYGCVEDVQKFLKRVRSKIDYLHSKLTFRDYGKFNKEDFAPQIRYAYTLEYGETTCRPHYHGLFFFKSPLTASSITEIIRSCWTFGIVDSSPVNRSCSSYVASYINSIACLPKVYRHPQLRPFIHYSKCPVIGSLFADEKEVFEIFSNGLAKRSEFDNGKVVDVPVDPLFKTLLFPKCERFGNITHFERVALYSIAKNFPAAGFDSFEEKFVSWIDSLPTAYDYVDSIKHLRLLRGAFDPHGKRMRLYRLWCISRRVLTQSLIFGCTLDYYVSRIELFYRNRDMECLRQQLLAEVEFCQTYSSCCLPYIIDKDYFEDVCLGNINKSYLFNDRYNFMCESFGFKSNSHVNNFIYDGYGRLFRSLVSANVERMRKRMKTKRKNEYLAAHPEARNLVFF